MIRKLTRTVERLSGQLRRSTTLRRARTRFLRGGMGFFLLAALAGLGALAAYAVTRGEDAGGTYTLMIRTNAYTLETVVNGTTTTRVVRVRVPVRQLVTEKGRTQTRMLTGRNETVRLLGDTVVRVETEKVTVTKPVTVRVTVRDPVTVVSTVVVPTTITQTVTTTETVPANTEP